MDRLTRTLLLVIPSFVPCNFCLRIILEYLLTVAKSLRAFASVTKPLRGESDLFKLAGLLERQVRLPENLTTLSGRRTANNYLNQRSLSIKMRTTAECVVTSLKELHDDNIFRTRILSGDNR